MGNSRTTVVLPELMLLMMRARRHMHAAGDQWQLTPVQSMLLILLPENGQKSMNELANIMCCDASNITGLIEKLENGSFIERAPDKQDRRIKKIQLSDKGKDCRRTILAHLTEVEALDFKNLSEDEVRTISSIVQKLSL